MRKRPTVELPKYVQRVIVSGREYFYFQRGRGSKEPGPRITLPNDPHSEGFWAEYRRHLGSEVSTGKTFRHLIADYKVSPEFTGRADETKRDYKRYLDKIERAWGSFLVSSIRPKHVIALRDEFQETPSTANHLLSVLKTLINWGIPREYSEANPCVHVPKLEVEEEGARPWPTWAYKLVEEHGREDYRRAVLLGRYTGQRTADIVRMGTHDMEDGGLHVTQQKTGKPALDTDPR